MYGPFANLLTASSEFLCTLIYFFIGGALIGGMVPQMMAGRSIWDHSRRPTSIAGAARPDAIRWPCTTATTQAALLSAAVTATIVSLTWMEVRARAFQEWPTTSLWVFTEGDWCDWNYHSVFMLTCTGVLLSCGTLKFVFVKTNNDTRQN